MISTSASVSPGLGFPEGRDDEASLERVKMSHGVLLRLVVDASYPAGQGRRFGAGRNDLNESEVGMPQVVRSLAATAVDFRCHSPDQLAMSVEGG